MLCFVHVPKAAGTTVSFVLRQSLGHRFMELAPWVDDRRLVSPADIRLLRRWAPWIRHFGGHHVRAYSGLERVVPEIRYVTFLRDPVKRYLSDYYHLRYKNGRVANFHEFLGNRHWCDKQTKYIAGRADHEAAIELLEKRFQFVGLVEAMDESLALLGRRFDELPLDVRYGRPRNVARPGPAQQEVRDGWAQFEPRVRANNQHDLRLYEYVRDVLFPRYQQTCGGGGGQNDGAAAETSRATLRRRLWQYQASRAQYRLLMAFYRSYGRRRWPIDNRELSAEYDFFGEYVF